MKINNSALIRGYANAIFSIAQELHVTQFCSQLLRLLSCIIKLPLIRKIIAQNAITHEQKANTIAELLSVIAINQYPNNTSSIDVILPKMANFICLLTKKKKLNLIPYIDKKYDELYLKISNQMRINITTAKQLDAEEKQFWQQTLSNYCLRRFNKQPLIDFMNDNSIIGGLLIKYNKMTIDYSIKGRLLALQQTLNGT